jgi:hypothetical protein
MKIQLNDKTGLSKGTAFQVGDLECEITVLSVVESRSAWVRLMPWIRGMMMAEGLEKDEGSELGAVAMASIAGALNEDTITALIDLFAKKTSYEQVERADSGNQVVTKRVLAEKGVMDAVFAGNFESLIEWLDTCIQLNFGALISKLHGALVENASRKAPVTSDSDPAPKAKPTLLV